MINPQEVEKAILEAGCLISGNFTFASGVKATKKLDLEVLSKHPNHLAVVVRALADHPCLGAADLIMGVPNGAQRLFADRLGKLLKLPVAYLLKKVGGTRYDYMFATPADRKLALSAKHPRIIEDAVTTLGSVAGVARLLNPKQQDIQALIVWRRGKVDPKYRKGLRDHYLVEKFIPLN